MEKFLLCFLGIAFTGLVTAESEPNAFAPQLDFTGADEAASVYKGFIVTDETYVSLVPELRATDKDEIGGARFICGYRIYQDKDYDIPFEAEVTNHMDGRAKLRVKTGVKLEELLRQKYKFQISAFDCGSPTLHSEKAHVVVTMLRAPEKSVTGAPVTPPLPEDLKKLLEFAKVPSDKEVRLESPPLPDFLPTTTATPQPDIGGEQFFERPYYIVALREATLYDSILKLHPAADKTTTNICGYDLLTEDVPFAVNDLGDVRNTKALDFDQQKSYILSVVAKHCDGLVSKPAIINVQISKICTNGWKELPTDLEYKPNSKAINPFEDTFFETCDKTCEETENLSVTVSLESESNIDTCKHDAFSIQSQRDACGASPDTVDLLPKDAEWTQSLESVEGHETAYKFDGKTAVKVPSEHSNHTLGDFFSLSLWMSHGEEKKDGHKEHILCNSDGDGKNRHHYSLVVHNCRLVFLLRREAGQVEDLNKFQPAEWRWSIPQVCDGEWHHYSISVEYPQVKLFVDGQHIQDNKDTVEVVDDWALHPSKKVHFQQLTVGACWQGVTRDFGQYFDGSLAGLSMVQGTNENDRVVKCLNSCGEKLQFKAMDLLEIGMSVSFNTELTEITIKGNDPEEVKRLLRHVGYMNTNGAPKPGYRTLRITTNATCDGENLEVIEQTLPIMVSALIDPKITIGGTNRKLRTAEEFSEGVDIFTELIILNAPDQEIIGQEENRINKMSIEDFSRMQRDEKKRIQLDRCEVRIDERMNEQTEKLSLPTQLLVKYLLDSKEFDEGFDITGLETYAHYEEVLREVFYANKAIGPDFKSRKFTVRCSDMSGKFQSNTYSVEVGLMESNQDVMKLIYDDPSFAHAQKAGISLEENSINAGASLAASSGSGVVVAVVVICSLLLVSIIGVAAYKIKTTQRSGKGQTNVTVEDGPEMEWDNSTLNITVNPLESGAMLREAEESESEEELSEFGEDGEPLKDGLEWDNSAY